MTRYGEPTKEQFNHLAEYWEAEVERLKDPEYARAKAREAAEAKREEAAIMAAMAAMGCKCLWSHCDGHSSFRCKSADIIGAGFLHFHTCHKFKPWMEDYVWKKDGFQLKGSKDCYELARKGSYDFIKPMCPACVSELKRRAAAKSAEVRREKRAERDIDIIMLWDVGKSQRFIAKALECSVGTINGALSRMAKGQVKRRC